MQLYILEKLLIEGLYHSDKGHKDENWELECKRQIFQEGSEKTTDPFPDAYQRLRNEHHNGNWDGLEQMVKVRSQIKKHVNRSWGNKKIRKGTNEQTMNDWATYCCFRHKFFTFSCSMMNFTQTHYLTQGSLSRATLVGGTSRIGLTKRSS